MVDQDVEEVAWEGMDPDGTVARVRRAQSWVPLIVTIGLAVLGLAGWQAVAVSRLPEPIMHPNRFDGVIYWAGPNLGPFYAKQDVHSAELLFVGDSRVYDDTDLDVVRRSGEDSVGLIWGPNADLSVLLPAIMDLPAERLVVALSPSTLGAKTNPVMRASLVTPPPVFEPLSLESALGIWVDGERARLIEEGYTPFIVDTHLSSFRKVLRETTRRSKGGTHQLDRVVGERLNYFRTENIRTLATRRWHREWFEVANADKLVNACRITLEVITEEERAAAEEIVVEKLRELVARGVDVRCVRFPVSPSVLAVEREFVPDARLEAIAAAAGVPYYQFQSEGLPAGVPPSEDTSLYETRDGSHLTWAASRRFTRQLMERIQGPGSGK
jgi:hypothetical protein